MNGVVYSKTEETSVCLRMGIGEKLMLNMERAIASNSIYLAFTFLPLKSSLECSVEEKV